MTSYFSGQGHTKGDPSRNLAPGTFNEISRYLETWAILATQKFHASKEYFKNLAITDGYYTTIVCLNVSLNVD